LRVRPDREERKPVEQPEALIARFPDCLHWSPDGEIRVLGHRIGLYHLIRLYNEGYNAEMLLCQYPTLELVTIHKVIVFYLENRALVDDYLARYQAELDHLRATGRHGSSLAELRARWEARRHAVTVDADRM
jgi:uncharacterized protein (DUF433 family)